MSNGTRSAIMSIADHEPISRVVVTVGLIGCLVQFWGELSPFRLGNDRQIHLFELSPDGSPKDC